MIDVFVLSDDNTYERIGVLEPDGGVIESRDSIVGLVASDLAHMPVDDIVRLYDGPFIEVVERSSERSENEQFAEKGPDIIEYNNE